MALIYGAFGMIFCNVSDLFPPSVGGSVQELVRLGLSLDCPVGPLGQLIFGHRFDQIDNKSLPDRSSVGGKQDRQPPVQAIQSALEPSAVISDYVEHEF